MDEPARGMPSLAGISGVHRNFVGEVMIGVKDSNKVALAVLEAKQGLNRFFEDGLLIESDSSVLFPRYLMWTGPCKF